MALKIVIHWISVRFVTKLWKWAWACFSANWLLKIERAPTRLSRPIQYSLNRTANHYQAGCQTVWVCSDQIELVDFTFDRRRSWHARHYSSTHSVHVEKNIKSSLKITAALFSQWAQAPSFRGPRDSKRLTCNFYCGIITKRCKFKWWNWTSIVESIVFHIGLLHSSFPHYIPNQRGPRGGVIGAYTVGSTATLLSVISYSKQFVAIMCVMCPFKQKNVRYQRYQNRPDRAGGAYDDLLDPLIDKRWELLPISLPFDAFCVSRGGPVDAAGPKWY